MASTTELRRRIAYKLTVELELAFLSREYTVSVNRDTLHGIAKRIMDRVAAGDAVPG